MSFDGDLYPTAGATSVLTTKGDMVDFDTARQRFGIGSANQILQVKSSLPSWETVPLADTVLTTAGDILYEDATPALARLASGTQYNTLQMGATLPAWSSSATSVLSTTGDLLYASGANTLARLAGGTSGDVLTANGAGVAPSYQTPSGGGTYSELVNTTLGSAGNLTGTWVGTYRVLQIYVYAKSVGGTANGIRWNGDNAGNYNGVLPTGANWTGEKSTDFNNSTTNEFVWSSITVNNVDSEMKLITVTSTLSSGGSGTAPTFFQSWNMWTNSADYIQNCQLVERNAGTLKNFATDSHLLVLGLN